MALHHLRTELWVPAPLDEVFAFFADANNLSELTPPWVQFEILTKNPIEMRTGAVIDYRIRIRRIPVGWRTEITAWEPPYRFVDEQRRGPYRHWRHEHTFEEQNGGTWIRDTVEYAAPGWLFEPLVHRLFVRRDVERIFSYRRERMVERFGSRNQHVMATAEISA